MGSLVGDLVALLLGRGTTMGLAWLVRTTIEGTAHVLSDDPPAPQPTQDEERQVELNRLRKARIHVEIDDMKHLTED